MELHNLIKNNKYIEICDLFNDFDYLDISYTRKYMCKLNFNSFINIKNKIK